MAGTCQEYSFLFLPVVSRYVINNPDGDGYCDRKSQKVVIMPINL